jgi:hypothetical protein
MLNSLFSTHLLFFYTIMSLSSQKYSLLHLKFSHFKFIFKFASKFFRKQRLRYILKRILRIPTICIKLAKAYTKRLKDSKDFLRFLDEILIFPYDIVQITSPLIVKVKNKLVCVLRIMIKGITSV